MQIVMRVPGAASACLVLALMTLVRDQELLEMYRIRRYLVLTAADRVLDWSLKISWLSFLLALSQSHFTIDFQKSILVSIIS
jgi:hypothetical protein